MDNEFGLDLAEVAAILASADVAVVRFITAPKRLLLDFRATEVDGPCIAVVEPVRSIEERYKDLKRLRPRFPLPERIHVIWWPRYVSSLVATGMWERVVRRAASSGHGMGAESANEALRELIALEAALTRSAITGDGFQTIWSASPATR